MANTSFQSNPAFAKMTEDARKAVTQAFDAMSSWRNEMAQMSEKNSQAAFDKMSEAAKALGWPTDYVEMSRKQVQQATKMQLQVVDQMMDAWEKQVTSASSGAGFQMPAMPSMPTFPGMPSFGSNGVGNGSFPGMPDMTSMPNPMQFWMQAAEMWQKNWQQAMTTWMDAQSNMMNKGGAPGSKMGPR